VTAVVPIVAGPTDRVDWEIGRLHVRDPNGRIGETIVPLG